MNFKEIQELIKLINKSNLTEFKMKDGDFQLSIRTKKYGKGRQQIVPVQTASMPAVQQSFIPPAVNVPPSPPPAESITDASEKSEDKGREENTNLIEIRSPIVGTFYRSASPEKPPYLKIGDVIEVGNVICIVEAMKLFNEIESEVRGKVVNIMVEDAQPVEYDQVLFLVDPNG